MAGTHRTRSTEGGRRRRKAKTPRRARRILLWTAGSIAALVLIGAGTLAFLYFRLDGNIRSVELDDKLGDDRPEDLSPGAKTILVVGSDSREGMGDNYDSLDTMQSDTLMIMHISEDRDWATVASVPRDSWVEIPECDQGDGTVSEPHYAKINESFTIGGLNGDVANAAACTVKTVEHNSGLRIDNFISLDFVGFKDMVDALDGVEVCPEEAIDDEKAKLTLEAGCQTLTGEEALGYVRVRYSVGDGSDLGRIERQQEFMAALASKAQSKLSDPTALYDFMAAVTKSLTTDPELAGLRPLQGLASELQGVPEDQLTFLTVPNYPRELDVPEDTANVVWEYPEAELLFTSLAKDEQMTKKQLEEAAEAAPNITPSEIRVRVLNGTGTAGQAAEVSQDLSAAGFQVVATGNAFELTSTTSVSYPGGLEAHADILASRVPGASTVEGEADTPGVLTLIIGDDFPGVTG